MHVSGQIQSACPPDQFVSAFQDVGLLRQLLPSGSELEATGDGAYAFLVTRSFGPIRLTLPGKFTLTPTVEGPGLRLIAQAAHLMGGKVDLDLTVTFDTSVGRFDVVYSGTLASTGLAGRVLHERLDRIDPALKKLLRRVRNLAEARLRPDANRAASGGLSAGASARSG